MDSTAQRLTLITHTHTHTHTHNQATTSPTTATRHTNVPSARHVTSTTVSNLVPATRSSGITFITQGVEEIVNSPIGSAILNNTATKLIMLQKGDTRVLNDALKLNSQELRLIQSLEQRKGVISEGFLMEGEPH